MANTFSDAIIVAGPGSLRKLTEEAAEWLLSQRRIRWSSAGKMPVASGSVWFGELKRKSEAIFFKYESGWKARAWPDKAFTQADGTKAEFWNLEAVLNGPLTDVWISEGELDAMAFVESGLRQDQVLAAPAAPFGKPAKDAEEERRREEDPNLLAYINEALARGLGKAKRFIWCGDQDDAGLRLRAAAARRLGQGKFYFVEWPEGCKDGNDFLRSDGPEALHDRLTNGFLAWPITGLYRMDSIPEQAPLTLWKTGFELWDNRVHLAPGTMSVATGHPGMGKTLLWTQIFFQILHQYNVTACIASFETRAKPHLQRILRTLFTGLLVPGAPEVRAADQWINDHYLFLLHPDRRPEIGWLLDQGEAAVVRHGIKILQVDPWNRLEDSKGERETETEYVRRCLRELYNFAVDLNVHVQVIAHPAKMEGHRRGQPPELEDIASSKHWDNMVDQGFVVHRPKLYDEEGNRETYAEVYHKKTRFDELGYATRLGLDFNLDHGRFYSCRLRNVRRQKKAGDNGGDDD